MNPENTARQASTAPVPRLLFLQASSIHERVGGVEQYLEDLLNVAADQYGGDAIHSIIPLRDPDSRVGETAYSAHPVRMTPSSSLLRPLFHRFSPPVYRKAKQLLARGNFDFIVCGHISLAPLAHALSRASQVPFLCIAYGIEAWGGGFALDEWAFKKAYGMISISRWTREVLIERDFFPENISVIRPRLPEDFQRIARPKTDFESSSKLRLLTVGRLDARERYKGQDHVIDALYRLKLTDPKFEFDYRIVGEGNDRPRLEALVEAAGLRESVSFLPDVSDREELADLYRNTDLHVMPSRFGKWGGRWRGEGFGIVYVEAAAFGVPSLAYACGGVTDIVRDGIDGVLVEPDDIACLSRVLIELHRRRRVLRELGTNAYSRVMTEFTGKAMARQLDQTLGLFLSRRTSDRMPEPVISEPAPDFGN